MQHRKKNLDVLTLMCLLLSRNMCYKITAKIKYEMIGIVLVLIELILIIAVLIIHVNNTYSA